VGVVLAVGGVGNECSGIGAVNGAERRDSGLVVNRISIRVFSQVMGSQHISQILRPVGVTQIIAYGFIHKMRAGIPFSGVSIAPGRGRVIPKI
jgi:hypothetical protein